MRLLLLVAVVAFVPSCFLVDFEEGAPCETTSDCVNYECIYGRCTKLDSAGNEDCEKGTTYIDSFRCDSGDIYFFDNCDRRRHIKESCNGAGCTGDSCDQHSCSLQFDHTLVNDSPVQTVAANETSYVDIFARNPMPGTPNVVSCETSTTDPLVVNMHRYSGGVCNGCAENAVFKAGRVGIAVSASATAGTTINFTTNCSAILYENVCSTSFAFTLWVYVE